ncbi:hypothetical protein D3C71_1004510 [compost metagenome]
MARRNHARHETVRKIDLIVEHEGNRFGCRLGPFADMRLDPVKRFEGAFDIQGIELGRFDAVGHERNFQHFADSRTQRPSSREILDVPEFLEVRRILACREALGIVSDACGKQESADVVRSSGNDELGRVDDASIYGFPDAIPGCRQDVRSDTIKHVPRDILILDLDLELGEVRIVDDVYAYAGFLGERLGEYGADVFLVVPTPAGYGDGLRRAHRRRPCR